MVLPACVPPGEAGVIHSMIGCLYTDLCSCQEMGCKWRGELSTKEVENMQSNTAPQRQVTVTAHL